MENKKTIIRFMNFLDGQGGTYRRKCDFTVHDGNVISAYDCPILQEYNVRKNPYSVSYGAGNNVFVQHSAGCEENINKALWQARFLRQICKNCELKHKHR